MAEKRRVEDILRDLRTKGHRLTEARRATLEILFHAKLPLAVEDLAIAIKSRGLKTNKTTIYRETAFLVREKIAREIDLLDGKKRYELLHAHDHHHHVVCITCKDIRCIEMHHDLDEIEKRLEKQHDFTITSHSLEFFGECGKCRKKGSAAR